MKLKSNADVLRFAKLTSDNNNISLSTYCFGFYVALVRVVFEKGFYDNQTGLFVLYCTPSGLAEFLPDYPLKRFSPLLSQLAKSGLLTYDSHVTVDPDLVCGRKPFKRSKPLKLLIDLSALLEE